MGPRRFVLTGCCAALLLMSIAPPVPGREGATIGGVPPVVIAIVEPGGFNVLHSDFRLDRSIGLQLPADLPARTTVRLPGGTWTEQSRTLQSGPLGSMEPNTLYSLPGTRILGIWTSASSAVTDLMEDRDHGTGTASSAVGTKHGTAPEAWLVFVPDVSKAAWRWVARQSWIDVVSTSYAAPPEHECASAGPIARIVRQGRMVFAAIGNGEQLGSVSDPSGVPEAYQVGGVDDAGRPYIPLASGSYVGTPNRPYETGDLFDSRTANSSSLHSSEGFGGTSAAAPSTAGRAASLIQRARALLESSGSSRGPLVEAGGAARRPHSGPLADGDFTSAELADLLHSVAIPSLPASPLRYLYEGFGALNDDAIKHADRILEGRAEMPERPEDQAMHEQVEAARGPMMGRC